MVLMAPSLVFMVPSRTWSISGTCGSFFSACGSRLPACEKAFESVLDSVGIVSECLGDKVEKSSPNYSSAQSVLKMSLQAS